MKKFGRSGVLLVFVLSATSCGGVGSVVAITATCSASLLAQVGTALAGQDWSAALDRLEAGAGPAILCAVQHFASGGTSAGAGSGGMGPRAVSPVDLVKSERAQQWLAKRSSGS